MIIAKIIQEGQIITLEDVVQTFQYSTDLKMQFVRDENYADAILTGWYKKHRGEEYLLDIKEDGTFNLGKDIFSKEGSVYFSFALNYPDGRIVHLGIVEYFIKKAFGNGDAILPEEKETWISVVSRVVEDQVFYIWDRDYKPQLEENLNIIDTKTEEIKAAANKVKEDALESSNNAKNALESANLAKTSADNASLSERKALEHMSNAETFKNNASGYADQAGASASNALESATNASNSASNALDNANKAKDHLDNVIEKTNAFNASVETVNNTLDAKIEKANTDIDKKVLDANTSLDKKISDANTNIDAKVTVATEQANIATSKATELKDAVDKVKYLDDVVDTKLTQPYVSSSIIENATISDSDEGQLRNLRVYGKCTQTVEENIVPTPNRPVPIISKKIVVGEEVVELRSLKESVNLWDSRLMNYAEGNDIVAQTWAKTLGLVTEILPWVKQNTTYTCKCIIEMLEKSVDALQDISKRLLMWRSGSNNYGLPAWSANMSSCSTGLKNGETIENTCTFTTPEDLTGVHILVYCERYTDENNVANYSKIAFRNIMLVEGTTVPTSYIAPAIRDYKVVDHANKKSWIERNVTVENLSSRTNWFWNGNNTVYTSISGVNKNSLSLSNYFSTYEYSGVYINGLTVNINKAICIKDPSFNTLDDAKKILSEKEVLCYAQLETPIIEEISYNEDDITEFGSSFQDSTSPSPNIKSPIEKVDVLNIKACAKNMFNPQNLSGGEIVTYNGVECYKYKDSNNNFIFDFSHNVEAKSFTFTTRIYRDDGISNGTYMHFRYSDGTKATMNIQNVSQVYTFTSDPSKILKKIEGNYSYVKVCYIDLSVTQLEVGDTATEYEPYKETAISHELATPLLKIGDIADTIDLNNLIRTNNNYFGLLDLANQGIAYGGLVGNYRSCYWRANTMPKPKKLKNNEDKNNLLCDRTVANIRYYTKDTGETISIYKDGSADFIAVFNINRFKDINEFKQFFVDNPTMVAYPLATPMVEPLEPELVEKLKTLMSFYPVTHIFSNVPISFDHKLNLASWHKVISGQVEDARDIIYNMQVQQNNLEAMQLESALETQYNMDLLKLGGM